MPWQAVSDTKLQIADATRAASLLSDASTALELLDADAGTEDTELLHEASALLHQLEGALDAWELERLLDMPYASSSAVLTISAGAGGTDAQVSTACVSCPSRTSVLTVQVAAQDWAEMLSRMYERWASKQGFTAKARPGHTSCFTWMRSTEASPA